MKTIKRHSNRNFYVLNNSGYWVRNYAKYAKPFDINNLTEEADYKVLIQNEIANLTFRMARIDAETIYAPKCVIVSDGYQFEQKQDMLAKLNDQGVVVIGTNRCLPKWRGEGRIDYYVVNNPYRECLSYLPDNGYYPRCIASCRTYPEFLFRYRQRRGVLYQYTPVFSDKLASVVDTSLYKIDDYRNPICAAIGLAYRWGVEKLALLCCDTSFEGERPGAIQLPNKLWMYPQQKISHDFIDGNLYWLKQFDDKVRIVNHSSGPEYEGVPYITADELLRFF